MGMTNKTSLLLFSFFVFVVVFVFVFFFSAEMANSSRMEWGMENWVLAWIVPLLSFVAIMQVTPSVPQSQSYHNFADCRQFCGVPNTLNVISNLPFLFVGIGGLFLCLYENFLGFSLKGELLGWTCFYIGITATGFGSAYYHIKPNDARLVWDRLPMTIGFSSIMAVFVIERVDEQIGNALLFPLLLAGIVSVVYWRFVDDLRPYALVQFVPCIAIPIMTITLPPKYTHSVFWLWAAGCYLVAKLEEAMDWIIYKWSRNTVSGHTLKHLFSALVPFFITIMLLCRTIEINSASASTTSFNATEL